MKKTTVNKHKKNILKNDVFIKSMFAVFIAVVCLFFIFLIAANTGITSKIIGFILYFVLAVFLIYEFIKFFPLPKWTKFYLPLLVIISFFFPWKTLVDWFKDQPISINDMIRHQYEYRMFNIPGIGYAVQALLCALPFLFWKKKREDIPKYYILIYIVVIFITIAAKSALLVNNEKVIFLITLIAGPIICDSFAYIGGKVYGNKIFKKKLAPKISPNKTIEGAMTGFIVAWLVLFFIYRYHSFNYLYIDQNIIEIVFPILIPIISIVGDLFFSFIKRTLRIKDYSNLIPGHGGLLDRLDSIILVCFIFIPFLIV